MEYVATKSCKKKKKPTVTAVTNITDKNAL